MTFKALLKSKKITQQGVVNKFFKKFNYIKKQQQVSDWVSGKRFPDMLSILYLSKILETSTDVVIESLLKSAGGKW